MPTSQHLDKTAPRRFRLRLRRRGNPSPVVDGGQAPVDADDVRALQAANRRIVALEMTVAVQRYRLDRAAGICAPPCVHAVRLAEAESALRSMRGTHSDFYRRLHQALGDVKDANERRPGGDR